ncbi:peptide chain release factor N(5)-glutamine methyltransferase [Furfurilactobacillus sp. WILCCON 0119]
MANPTMLEAQQWASSCFTGTSAGADPQLAETLMMDLFNWRRTQLLMQLRESLTDDQWTTYQQAVHRIANGEPEQYITGHAMFYGHDFSVSPAVLIPRPETEELVEWLLNDCPESDRPQTVVDVGTGSGALAIATALARPTWHVTGTDISDEAIAVAKHNGAALGASVSWVTGDLYAPITDQRFDILLSNPPYISEAERPLMDESVISYEPHGALFADEDGLALYRRLAAGLAEHLTTYGRAYFEIGYAQGPAVVTLMQQAMPSATVTLKQDITGHDRMVRVTLG